MLASSLQQSGYAQQGVVNYAQQGVYTAGPVTSGAVHVTTAHVHQPAPTTMLTTETSAHAPLTAPRAAQLKARKC